MRRLKKFFNLALGLGVFFCPQGLQAFEMAPFHTQNQSPVVQIFGLPPIGEGSILPSGKIEARVTVDLANNYVVDTNLKEILYLDGESTRIALTIRYGVARGLECGVTIPYLFLNGGFLDRFIEGFHTAFGFQQGWRDQDPRNRLLYLYKREGRELLNIANSNSGLGDIHLTGGWQLYEEKNKGGRAVALRAGLKLPTGDSGQLRGSGSTDFSLWVTAGDGYRFPWGRLTLFGSAGIMVMNDGQVLRDQQRNWVGFGGLGVGWSPLSWLSFKIQADAHTPFYRNSELRELNANAAQLTFGGTLTFSDRTALDIGVTEDIVVLTAPDVVFHFSLRRRF